LVALGNQKGIFFTSDKRETSFMQIILH
jgi:hypothetical protein